MQKPLRVLLTTLAVSSPPVAAQQTLPGAGDTHGFPEHVLSLGGYEDALGLRSLPTLPPFLWRGVKNVDYGVLLMYERLWWHTQKRLSLHWGLSFGHWNAGGDALNSLSAFVSARWWAIVRDDFDVYVHYSLGGPTLLSERHAEATDLGGWLSFQDFFGVGVRFGRESRFHVSALFVHYSHGELLGPNPGLDVPVLVTFGMTF